MAGLVSLGIDFLPELRLVVQADIGGREWFTVQVQVAYLQPRLEEASLSITEQRATAV